MKSISTILFLFLSSILILQGCGAGLGFAVIGNESSDVPYPCISKNKGYLSSSTTESDPITSNELLKYWGKPDKTHEIAKNIEDWTYNFSIRWNGLFSLITIVPIPLMVPVGKDHIVFTVNDGEIVSASMVNEGENGFLCGIFPPHLMCETYNTLGKHGNTTITKFIENDQSKLLRVVRE